MKIKQIAAITLFLALSCLTVTHAQSTQTTNLAIPKPNSTATLPTTAGLVSTGFDSFDTAIAGRLTKSVAGSADVTLTAQEACRMVLEFTGALTANINVNAPAKNKIFVVFNNTTGSYTLTFKTIGGDGIKIPQGKRMVLYCDMTNIASVSSAVGVNEAINVRNDFGAIGDGVANDTTAINNSITAAALSTGKKLYFPSGTYMLDGLSIAADSIQIYGDGPGKTVFRSRTNSAVLLFLNVSTATHSLVLRDFSIYGFGSGANNHGIQFAGAAPGSATDPFNVTFSNIRINNCGGRGVYIQNGLFTSRFEDIDITQPSGAGNAIDVYGANDITFNRCYVHTVGTGKAAFRFHSGAVTFIGCNTMDGGTTADAFVLGDQNGNEGDTTDHYVTAQFVNCNIELFTNRGIYAKTGSYYSLFNTKLITPASGTVTVLKNNFVSAGQKGVFDALSQIINQGASYTNGYALNSNGVPFILLGGTTITAYYDTAVGAAVTLSVSSTASGTGAKTIVWPSFSATIEYTFTGNTTFSFSGFTPGNVYTLILIQPSSNAGKNATWPSNVKWAGGSPPSVLSNTNSARDVFQFVATSSNTLLNTVVNFDVR